MPTSKADLERDIQATKIWNSVDILSVTEGKLWKEEMSRDLQKIAKNKSVTVEKDKPQVSA